jgi:hypothetical protein
MQTLSANEANCGFGRLIDLTRAEPMAAVVAKRGRPAVAVPVIEQYERLKPPDMPSRILFSAALAEIGGDEATYDLGTHALIDADPIKSSVLRSK